MKNNHKAEFIKILAGIAELYGKKLSQPLLEIYWQTLKKYAVTEITRAVNCHVLNPDNGQFMPKPADIIRYLEADANTQALQAWTKVLHAIQSVGAYSTVVFDDGLIHAVIQDMGGWIKLCQTLNDELPFKAQEFIKRYGAYGLRKPNHYPNKLCGIMEGKNSDHDTQSNQPVLIGNPQQALMILKQSTAGLLKS